jgi:hypothetical protein
MEKPGLKPGAKFLILMWTTAALGCARFTCGTGTLACDLSDIAATHGSDTNKIQNYLTTTLLHRNRNLRPSA